MTESEPDALSRRADGVRRRTLDDLVGEARARIERFAPAQALAAMRRGALLIDIRAGDERERDGFVPGSLHIPRAVLEWRVAPASRWRNPHVGGLEKQLVLLCAEGYSSILAAATLVDLGFRRAGDVTGGFAAWRETGLPVSQAERPRPVGLVGMQAPDY